MVHQGIMLNNVTCLIMVHQCSSFLISSHHLSFTIWLFNIARENPQNKWRFLAGKIIYFYGQWLPWLC
jgi:hypothetical protein